MNTVCRRSYREKKIRLTPFNRRLHTRTRIARSSTCFAHLRAPLHIPVHFCTFLNSQRMCTTKYLVEYQYRIREHIMHSKPTRRLEGRAWKKGPFFFFKQTQHNTTALRIPAHDSHISAHSSTCADGRLLNNRSRQ